MTLKEPLDLEYWFVNVFSGAWDIFMIVALIAITIGSAKFRMSFSTYMALLILFAALMAGAGYNYLLILLILVGAGALFAIIRKIIE